ncbi:MAG: hypothetical protein WB566_00035 [Terriglobales bacterium]
MQRGCASLVWEREPSPVRGELSSAAAWVLNHPVLAITAVAVLVLSLPFTTHAQNRTAPVIKSPAAPTEDAQLYRNTVFGFRYQIPYGWVDRTQEMQEENAAGKSALLLAVFERPPEATGDTVNSAVVIASESAAAYPGLKQAEDYIGPLDQITAANGFKPDGEPYVLEVESRRLLRADFLKTIDIRTNSAKLTMRQCTLVLLAKRQIVSFTFIGGGEDELDDLMDGLHFTLVKPSPR